MALNLSLNALYAEEFTYAFFLESSVTEADLGKAVTIDTSAAMTMKLTGDNEVIMGRLDTFEDRGDFKIGTVTLKGGFSFPFTGTAPALGEGLVGSATAGVTKSSGAAAAAGQPIVFKVLTDTVEVVLG